MPILPIRHFIANWKALDDLRDLLNLLSIIRMGFISYAFVGKVVNSNIKTFNDPK